MNSMFSVSFAIICNSGVYVGTGMSRSVKTARRAAVKQAWDDLSAADNKTGHCSNIGMEWVTVSRNGKVLHHDAANDEW